MEPLRRKRISTCELVWAILIVSALAAGGMWFWRQVQIDRCLDAGGRWEYARQECQGAPER